MTMAVKSTTDPTTRDRYRAITELITTSNRMLLATHRRPDGDAIGCLLGMSNILVAMDRPHTAFCPDGIPAFLGFLPGAEGVVSALSTEPFDVTLLFDTMSTSLLPDGFPPAERRGTFVVIDHHMHFDEMGDLVVRRPAAAVGEILFEIADAERWPITRDVAMCLYTSIASDTSSFKYESTTAESHLSAAALIERGAEPWQVATNLFESFSLERQQLLARVLQTLEVSLNGRLATLVCTQKMLAQTGASPDDLSGIVNFARSVDGVALAVLLREETAGTVRLSIRSKGQVDASQLSRRFGGGGHINAAGVLLENATIEKVLERVRDAAKDVLL